MITDGKAIKLGWPLQTGWAASGIRLSNSYRGTLVTSSIFTTKSEWQVPMSVPPKLWSGPSKEKLQSPAGLVRLGPEPSPQPATSAKPTAQANALRTAISGPRESGFELG